MISCLAEAGYTKPLTGLHLSDKAEISSCLTDFHLFHKVKSDMDQFMAGLQDGGVLPSMQTSTALMRPLFVYEAWSLTAGMLSIIIIMHTF